MKKKQSAKSPDALLKKLAASRPNDAVKLLFLDEEDPGLLDGLDLSLLTEMKRSSNGAVEIKLVNRLDIIRELYELTAADDPDAPRDAGFYAALDKAAQSLKDGGDCEV